MTDSLPETLRGADETTITRALERSMVSLPITSPVELLEAFNAILDALGVPDADGDVVADE